MWLINRKYNLVECGVLAGMTDTHSHLLWGVDDGARDEQRSRAMIVGMRSLGVARLFATPHIMSGLPMNSAQRLTALFEERLLGLSNGVCSLERPAIEMRLAGEYMLDEAFLPKLQTGEKLLTYDGKHLLIEMSHLNPPPMLNEMLFEVCSGGYVPVLAHPERYGYFATKDFERLKERGCRFQMNLLSLTAAYGQLVQRGSKRLLDAQMYDFVGSDLHSAGAIEAIKTIAVTRKVEQQMSLLIASNASLWL